MEPQTRKLLLGQYSSSQCRAMFPKKPKKAIAKEIDRLIKEIDAVKRVAPGADREIRELATRRQCEMMQRQYRRKVSE